MMLNPKTDEAGTIPATGNQRRRRLPALAVALFGIVFVGIVFHLTDDWLRRTHAIVVGTINVAAAVYLSRTTSKGIREKSAVP